MAESLKVGQLYAEITTKGLPTVTRGLDKLKAKVFSLKTAFVGLTAGLGLTKLAKEIINTGAEFETYRKRLLAVTKDQKVANEVFAEMSKWAAQNPVDTDDAIAAFVRLKSAAVENTKEATVAVGNLAALMGRSMTDTADALVAVNARTLRTYGIQLSTAGDKATIQIGKTVTVVKNGLQEIRQGIVSTVQKEYSNVMDLMKNTWEGNLKTMGGMWTELMRNIAGDAGSGGPFDLVKSTLIGVRKEWDSWMNSKSYEEFIGKVQAALHRLIVKSLDWIGSIAQSIADLIRHVEKYSSMYSFGLLGKLLFGKKTMIVLGAIGLIKDEVTDTAQTMKRNAEIEERYAARLKELRETNLKNSEALQKYGQITGMGAGGEPIYGAKLGLDEEFKAAREHLNKSMKEYQDFLAEKVSEALKEENPVTSIAEDVANGIDSVIPKLKTRLKYALDVAREGIDADADVNTGLGNGSGGNGKRAGASAEQRLNTVKAVIQRMRDEIAYAGASAAGFLPVLDQMLGRYPRLSEEWKAVKDLQLEGLEEVKTKAQESVQRIVEAEDWRYSVGITSAEQYFTTLKARYQDAMVSLEGVAEGSLRDKLTGQMREAYEGLQNVAVAALDQVREKMDAGAMSTEQAHAFALKLIDALNSLGIEPPEALKKFADGTDEAKERMKELKNQSKKWIEDFQSGIADAIVDGKNFGDVLTDIGKQIEKMILKMLLFGNNGDSGVFGGLFKGIGNLFDVKAPGRHTGGVVGVDPPSFFRSLLPKYHSGGIVGAGEELAILRKREAVFTPEQMKALGAAVNRPRVGDIKIEINAYNDGYGNMTNEQAQGIGEMVKDIVKAQVADEFYTYSRSGYFRTAGAM